MPGSPPISTTPPATMPPPSTRSNSSMPVGCRSTSDASISDKVVTGWLATNPLPPAAYRLRGAASSMDSTSVFQAPHCGHFPSHLEEAPPHSVQR